MIIPRSFGLKTVGIYKILNSINGKCYIGSSVNIYHRLKKHYSELNKQVHPNPYLQNAFNLYGKSAFVVSILAICAKEELLGVEQHYIDTLNPEYNLMVNVIRNELSKESKEKISQTLKEKYNSGILLARRNFDMMKSVSIYTLDCKLIKHCESEREAARELQKIYSTINSLHAQVNTTVNLKGKRRRFPRYKQHLLLKEGCECIKHIVIPSNSKPVIVENTLTGEIRELINITEAAKYIKCGISAVERALKKKRLIFKQFKTSRHEN